MGQLINGEWQVGSLTTSNTGGKFVRTTAGFRNWITPDGSSGPSGTGGFAAESGRYHLYVSYACPWAHRTLIFRALKDLTKHISISAVHPDMLEGGWHFGTDFEGATGDSLYGLSFARDVYTKAEPEVSGRVTVPILWDKKRETIVSNESSEIIRMFNSAFNALTGNTLDFYPDELRGKIDDMNERIYHDINNGVYKSGFASTQSAYHDAVTTLFSSLDWVEDRLSTHRYLTGDRVTEADWRLLTTLLRFDLVYHLHFKCNRKRVIDYPNIWAYTRELFQMPGVSETTNFEHIVRHYHYSHESVNPHRIIPINPIIDFMEPHGRGRMTVS